VKLIDVLFKSVKRNPLPLYQGCQFIAKLFMMKQKLHWLTVVLPTVGFEINLLGLNQLFYRLLCVCESVARFTISSFTILHLVATVNLHPVGIVYTSPSWCCNSLFSEWLCNVTLSHFCCENHLNI